MLKPHRRFGVASLIVLGTLAGAALPLVAGAQATGGTRSSLLSKPEGWLGIHYSAEAKIDQTGEGLRISYNSYPVIEAIEPGSPAERSGLQVGDTLIAFNGYDFVRRGVPMASLLRPGERLSIRLRRDGTRTVRVTVGERPAGAFGFSMRRPLPPGATVTVLAAPRAPIAEMELAAEVLRQASEQLPPQTRILAENLARQTARTLEREIVMNPSVAPLIAFRSPSGGMTVAGADMVPVNAGLGDVLGVRKGVLVVSVPAATPAARSGLRDGDVVVRAATTEIVDPRGLYMAMMQAGPAKTLQLAVVRKGRGQRVTLRW
ncbi:MAG: PDZ domain-containing protein [Gemmatimonadaceae bacterium]|nr:PDZ domain-containing protein [Gemmatimonadaceae bacterium]